MGKAGGGGRGGELLSVGEAAVLLGVSAQRVRDLETEGQLPEAMRIGPKPGRRAYRRADVERLKRQRDAKK